MRGSLFNHSRLLLIEATQLSASVKMQNVTCLFLNHQDRCENNWFNWRGRFTLSVCVYKITAKLCVKYLVIIVQDIIIDKLAVVFID